MRPAYLLPATCRTFRSSVPTSSLLPPWKQSLSARIPPELRALRRTLRATPSLRANPPGPTGGGNGARFNGGGGGGDGFSELYASSPELERLATKSTDAPVLARVVSYNVLSSSLAAPSHFRYCAPDDLDAGTRLARVLAKLEEAVASQSVICLQELSLAWAGPMHSFFARRGFHMITASYGSYFNGYMGVAIAFPTDVYDALDVSVERLSDLVPWPRAKRKSGFEKFVADVRDSIARTMSALAGESERDRRNRRSPWVQSQEKRNMLVFARLRAKTNGARLCVGTYHMPCSFWSPPIMLIHSALAVSQFQRLCGGDQAVLAGDFNIKPGDSAYEMITSGGIDPDHAHFPPRAPDGSEAGKWFPGRFEPMKSAYRELTGKEPDFTNYARVKEAPEFIETLDYIFCSKDVDVVDVIRLPDRNDVKGPFPVASQPSDHILIGATLRLPSDKATRRGKKFSR